MKKVRRITSLLLCFSVFFPCVSFGNGISAADGALAELTRPYGYSAVLKTITFDEADTIEGVRNASYFEYSAGSGSLGLGTADANWPEYKNSAHFIAKGSEKNQMNGLWINGEGSGMYVLSGDFYFKDFSIGNRIFYANIDSNSWLGGFDFKQGTSVNEGIASTAGQDSGHSRKLVINQWYNFTLVIDCDNQMYHYIMDDELIASADIGLTPQTINRASVEAGATGNSTTAEMYFDNFTVTQYKKERTTASVFESEDAVRAQLDGYTGMHLRSGCVYNKAGKKLLLKNLPYALGSDVMIPQEAVEALFDVDVKDVAGGLWFGTKPASSVAHEEQSGVSYYSLSDTAELFNQTVSSDNTATNGGIYLIGNAPFSFPYGDELQKLNNFLFFKRPSETEMKQTYETSGLYRQHPRIMASAADFAAIRAETAIGSPKAEIAKAVISNADAMLSLPVLKYELRDGVRLMYVSSELEERMVCFGMAYQLTGDRKYADRAYQELAAVAAFPDWHPSHRIDVGIMCVGFAIGYDWMYDAFTPEQRKVLENGIIKNGFAPIMVSYQTAGSPMSDAATVKNNHNSMCNGGALISALAFMDVDEETCCYIASNAIRGFENMLMNYAPDGTWYEGAYYGEINLNYISMAFSALEKTVGTLFRLDTLEGFSKASDYIRYVQSDVGCYNFADGRSVALKTPFWAEAHFGKAADCGTIIKNGLASGTKEGLPLALLWGKTGTDSAEAELDKYYAKDEIVLLHDSFDDNQTFAGIKAGDTIYEHSQFDSGSFVFDSQGTRWGHDLGADDYNLPGYWDTADRRWDIFRMRAESHNTIVVNPDGEPDYKIGSAAPVTEFSSNTNGAVVKIDTSALQAERLADAKRAFCFTDSRQSLVVRDELKTLSSHAHSDIYWMFYTRAEAQIEQESGRVILTDKSHPDRRLMIEFLSNQSFEIIYEPAKPLPGTAVVEGQDENAGFYRLALKISAPADTNVNITAKLTPYLIAGSSVADYDKPIKEWSIDDPKACSAFYLIGSGIHLVGAEYPLTAKVVGYPAGVSVAFSVSEDGKSFTDAGEFARDEASIPVLVGETKKYVRAELKDVSGNVLAAQTADLAGINLTWESDREINKRYRTDFDGYKDFSAFWSANNYANSFDYTINNPNGGIDLKPTGSEGYGDSCYIWAEGNNEPYQIPQFYARVDGGIVKFEADFYFKDFNGMKDLLQVVSGKNGASDDKWIRGANVMSHGADQGKLVITDNEGIPKGYAVLEKNQWYRLTEYVNTEDDTVTFYLNGRFLATNPIGRDIEGTWRANFSTGIPGEGRRTDMYIDNLCIEPVTEVPTVLMSAQETESGTYRIQLESYGSDALGRLFYAQYDADGKRLDRILTEWEIALSEDRCYYSMTVSGGAAEEQHKKIMLWSGDSLSPLAQSVIR